MENITNSIKLSLDSKNYYVVLMAVITIPDICVSLWQKSNEWFL